MDLVITTVYVEEGHAALSSTRINELVKFGEWEGILRVGLAEVRVIDAHSSFAAWFANHDDVGDPFGINGWFNASGCEEFVDLLCFHVPLLLTLVTTHLAYGLEGCVDIERVLYNSGGDPKQVEDIPQKYVGPLVQKGHELTDLLG